MDDGRAHILPVARYRYRAAAIHGCPPFARTIFQVLPDEVDSNDGLQGGVSRAAAHRDGVKELEAQSWAALIHLIINPMQSTRLTFVPLPAALAAHLCVQVGIPLRGTSPARAARQPKNSLTCSPRGCPLTLSRYVLMG